MVENENVLEGAAAPGRLAGRSRLVVFVTLVLSLGGCATVGGPKAPTMGPGAGAARAEAEVAGKSTASTGESQNEPSRAGSYLVFGKRYYVKDPAEGHVEHGLASWYGRRFHGRRTSSGERFNMHALTAAHKSLPLPTYAEVTNLDNGRSVLVKINDRGPFVDDRVIDVSYAAAQELAMVEDGVARVEVRPLERQAQAPEAESAGGVESRLLAAASSDAPTSQAVSRGRPAESRGTKGAALGSGRNDARLFVKVGDFGSRANAERLRQRLLAHIAEEVQILAGDSPAVQPYQVQVGPLATQEEVNGVAEQVAALGIARPETIVH